MVYFSYFNIFIGVLNIVSLISLTLSFILKTVCQPIFEKLSLYVLMVYNIMAHEKLRKNDWTQIKTCEYLCT